jgi:hypothetical protein
MNIANIPKLNQVDLYRYDLIQMAVEEEFPLADFNRDSIGLYILIPWPPNENDRLGVALLQQ